MRSNTRSISLLLALLLWVLSACAPVQPGSAAAPADSAATDGTPKRGGTVVIAVTEDPGHFNPGITTGFNVHVVTGSLFNGLVEVDDNANPLPDLATSWEISEGGKRYTFHLAEGVQWHDGQPFTSADVKFTFEKVLLQFHSRTKAGLEKILETIETPDDNTVIFTFKAPYAALLQRLNSTEAPILAKHIYEGVADIQKAAENLKPIGTGPFKFAEYAINDTVRLVRNENYFKAGLPYLDEVIYRVIPDQNTQVLAMEQGEVDFIWGVPGGEVERLSTDENIRLYNVNSGPGGGFCIMTVSFNLEHEVLQDLRVRQAIAHAIDREQILKQVIFGQGRVATGPIYSQMTFAYTPDVTQYAHDVAKANALLDEAGKTPGADAGAPWARFTINLLHFPNFSKYAEVMKANLAEVGINLASVPLERAAFLTQVFEQRDFDTNLISYCNNTDPSIGVSRVYVSTNIGNIPFSNGAAYKNEKVDELFSTAASEPDVAKRGELYGEVQRILADELPYWWLVETDSARAARANIEGLMPWSGHLVEAAWVR